MVGGITNMKYKIGDKVRIKSLDWYYKNRDRMGQVDCGNDYFIHSMTTLCEKVVTISSVLFTLKVYRIKEDDGIYNWTDEMFEGLVEEGNNMDNIDKLKRISTPAKENWFKIAEEWEKEDKEMDKLKHEVILPEGYIFKDESGNIINATKIILEKKKERYPKTYEECCEILGVNSDNFLTITNYYDGEVETTDYERGLLNKFAALWYLRICRDAYWKIADDWKEKRKEELTRHVIYSTLSGEIIKCTTINSTANYLLDFPTAEMRDAFYENFKVLIERCKELL